MLDIQNWSKDINDYDRYRQGSILSLEGRLAVSYHRIELSTAKPTGKNWCTGTVYRAGTENNFCLQHEHCLSWMNLSVNHQQARPPRVDKSHPASWSGGWRKNWRTELATKAIKGVSQKLLKFRSRSNREKELGPGPLGLRDRCSEQRPFPGKDWGLSEKEAIHSPNSSPERIWDCKQAGTTNESQGTVDPNSCLVQVWIISEACLPTVRARLWIPGGFRTGKPSMRQDGGMWLSPSKEPPRTVDPPQKGAAVVSWTKPIVPFPFSSMWRSSNLLQQYPAVSDKKDRSFDLVASECSHLLLLYLP
jgi:hypothetical protein